MDNVLYHNKIELAFSKLSSVFSYFTFGKLKQTSCVGTRGDGGMTSQQYLTTRTQSGLVWMRLCIGTFCKKNTSTNQSIGSEGSCVHDSTQPEPGPDPENITTTKEKVCMSRNEDLYRPAVSSNGGEVCAGIKPGCNPCSLNSQSNE